MTACVDCKEPTPDKDLDGDDRCPVCAALCSLRLTLERRGIIHRELWDIPNQQLPPTDR